MASKDSATVLWTRWASTEPTLWKGMPGGHTLVDNNIEPSQFRYLTRLSSPEWSYGEAAAAARCAGQ